jgi:hypothetical protein
VHEDLIDEPDPEALIDNVGPEHEHVAAPGSAVATASLTSPERKM